MITGITKSTAPKTLLETTLEKLELSPYQFQLTGSRFFGRNTTNSDWDFFVQETGEIQQSTIIEDTVEKFLENIGFVKQDSALKTYGDSNTIAIYRLFSILPKYDEPINLIDVQVVKNFNRKLAAQGVIAINFHLLPREKLLRKQFWNMILGLLQ